MSDEDLKNINKAETPCNRGVCQGLVPGTDEATNINLLKGGFIMTTSAVRKTVAKKTKTENAGRETTKKVIKTVSTKDKKEEKVMTKINVEAQSQKALKAKITEKMMDHEIFRLCEMDDEQMKARIRKIKNPVKLEALRIAAVWCGVRKFARLARKRRNAWMV